MVFAAQNCGLNDAAPPRSDLYTGGSEGRRRFQGRIGRRRGTKGKEKDELGGGFGWWESIDYSDARLGGVIG